MSGYISHSDTHANAQRFVALNERILRAITALTADVQEMGMLLDGPIGERDGVAGIEDELADLRAILKGNIAAASPVVAGEG